MDQHPPRLQAARWVITLGRLYGGLLVVVAAWLLITMVFIGSPLVVVLSLVLAGWAAAWGALVRAFEAHRRWAWRLMVALSAVSVGWSFLGWLLGRPPTVLSVLAAAIHGVLLGLLLHDDSREWVDGDLPSRRSRSGRGEDTDPVRSGSGACARPDAR
jgi:hypothetical protein